MVVRYCAICEKVIPKKPGRQMSKYCSYVCSTEAIRLRSAKSKLNSKTYEFNADMSTVTAGALGELLVCVDLLKRGYHVFRAVSPTCACDLIAMRDGVCQRIEVRSGYRNRDGVARWSKAARDEGRSDIYAVVLTDHTIHYDPPLEAP